MTAQLRPLHPGVVVAVAGISQHQDTAARTAIGDEVVLRHEVSNPYDRSAVRIDTADGDTLGYVPRVAQLNERLLVGHPGGMWAGVVVDRYDGETVGMRVRILSLVGHLNPKFGADHAGYRDVSDDTSTPAADGGGAASDAPAARLVVFAKGSGRPLGEFVENVEGRVRVRSGDKMTAFPAAVVEVRPLAS